MEVNALVHAIYMLMVGVCCASLAIWMFVDSRFKYAAFFPTIVYL